ncbi:integrase [Aquitalea magnusonii]|uniref:Integrase n=1 Tax=Aquitalea magnusonii TaxID=332411 RepID=A0A3G9GMK1_9NEIS|nr:integrase arm-type DNA-binding domain-containing protein [Aquitalea magnusonii]BBF87092.1 integrase [Aquitalea magnusonii]
MPLTDAQIKAFRPSEDGKPVKLADGQGLFLMVMPNGSKYWRYHYRFAGKQKTLALGVYPDIPLKQARTKREDARRLLDQNTDPGLQKQVDKLNASASNATTFELIAREWHASASHEWSQDHADRVLASLETHIFPFLGELPISQIKPMQLLAVLQKVERAGKIDTALRLKQRCASIFDLAVRTERCDTNPVAPLSKTLRTQQSTPRKALHQDDLPDFLKRLASFDGNKQTALMMELALLTFTRVGELSQARWEEIDFEKALWTIPPEHRKLQEKFKNTAPPHLVPLSSSAIAVLRSMEEISGGREHVFPNRNDPRRPMSPETLRRALHSMGYKGKADVHGFRATASTILNEAGFNPDAIERQLSHVETNKVRAAYNRAEYIEERVKMMEWWAKFLESHSR